MKKILSSALCVCMLTGAFATYSAFADDTVSDWAKDTVKEAIADGIVPQSITSETDYTENIDRLQFSELIYNAFEKTGKVTADKDLKSPFTDIDNNAVTCLHKDGIIAGKGDNKFAPDDFLTREEASTILGRAIKAYTTAMPESANSSKFTDDASIHDWAYNFVYSMKEAKILEGFEDGSFRPLSNMSKEEAIAVADRSRDSAGLSDDTVTSTPAPTKKPAASSNSGGSSNSGNGGGSGNTGSSVAVPTTAPTATQKPANGEIIDDEIIDDTLENVGDDVPDFPDEPESTLPPVTDVYVDESLANDGPPPTEEIPEDEYLPPTSEEMMEDMNSMPSLDDLLKEDGLL